MRKRSTTMPEVFPPPPRENGDHDGGRDEGESRPRRPAAIDVRRPSKADSCSHAHAAHLGAAGATGSGFCSGPVVSRSSSRWLTAAWATTQKSRW